ncbi:MAG: trypsin-like peptidase domain-containing protein [Chloroflexota bacterium]|nr:trypsin-like peptidase domain-containing protein [Chloroflexota bacterium]
MDVTVGPMTGAERKSQPTEVRRDISQTHQRLRKLLVLLLAVQLLAACQVGSASSTAQNGKQLTSSTSAATTTAAGGTGAASNTGAGSSSGSQVYAYSLAGSKSVAEVVRSVKDGVVEIIAQQSGDTSLGQTGSGGYATGSGFVIDNSGHILTNNHVVEGADKLTVVLPNNQTTEATLVGTDPVTDLAVLRVRSSGLKALKLGDSSKLETGEQVVAIGSALGLLGGPTVTTGVVSALNRSETEPSSQTPTLPGYFPGESGSAQSGASLFGLIQTDAAVNPGNSGGPLLDMTGAVIGINTLGQRSTDSGQTVEGINFAIPINSAREVAREIIQKGKVTYPYIGIGTRFLYPEISVTQGLPKVLGQYVVSVEPGTPAESAGLRRGDIITAIEGQRIDTESAFVQILREHEPGDKITLTVRRDGRDREVALTLARRPSTSSQEPATQP